MQIHLIQLAKVAHISKTIESINIREGHVLSQLQIAIIKFFLLIEAIYWYFFHLEMDRFIWFIKISN